MDATMDLDRRLLRAIRREPTHGYALIQRVRTEEGPDRATIYRRLASLAERGLVRINIDKSERGPSRKVFSLTPHGEASLHGELQDAMRRLLEAYHGWTKEYDNASSPFMNVEIEAPVAFIVGARMSASEHRILSRLGAIFPGRVHLVIPSSPDVRVEAPRGVAWSHGSAADVPLPGGHARVLLVNEVPGSAVLGEAVREWARVVGDHGAVHMMAPAGLPVGVDPFVDFLAGLQGELWPETRARPSDDEVTATLKRRFSEVFASRAANHVVWSARGVHSVSGHQSVPSQQSL